MVSDNTLTGGGKSSSYGISISASCTDVTARGNTGYDGPRSALILSAAPGSLIEGNRALWTGAGACVTASTSAVGTVYRSNVSSGTSYTVSGTPTDQTATLTLNTNPAGAPGNGAAMFWSPGDPTTTQPNRRSARGDVAWNSSASGGGVAGWICTAAGTPGTWKELGIIAA